MKMSYSVVSHSSTARLASIGVSHAGSQWENCVTSKQYTGGHYCGNTAQPYRTILCQNTLLLPCGLKTHLHGLVPHPPASDQSGRHCAHANKDGRVFFIIDTAGRGWTAIRISRQWLYLDKNECPGGGLYGAGG